VLAQSPTSFSPNGSIPGLGTVGFGVRWHSAGRSSGSTICPAWTRNRVRRSSPAAAAWSSTGRR
jgi:hypothetical protein